MEAYYDYETPIGTIWIGEKDGAITHLTCGEAPFPSGSNRQETSGIQEAARQLIEYLNGRRMEFTLPLAPEGTQFQKKVWRALQEIPYGETRSYQQVAQAIGNPKACRAVGMANHRNPILLVIPCHRVIGANGSLVGYGGGLPLKEELLRLEAEHSALE